MNRITITPTKFQNIRSGIETLGFRAYDEYGQTYGNTMETIPDDDLEFLQEVVEQFGDDEKLGEMLDFIKENEQGIDIDETYYEWEQIKDIV